MELRGLQHELSVELDIGEAVTTRAVRLFRPDVIVCPFLKTTIPRSVWSEHLCLVVHPGPPGDRGPHALDWAILRGVENWGVTVLQADDELDAGPIWAFELFAMRLARKSSLYRHEVTEAAVAAVVTALDRFQNGIGPLSDALFPTLESQSAGWQPAITKAERAIDWSVDTTETALRKIHSADGAPGVEDRILNERFRLFDARVAKDISGRPGTLIGRSGDAILRATVDGALWLGQLRPVDRDGFDFKQPAVIALGRIAAGLPTIPSPFVLCGSGHENEEIRYIERDHVGYLHFDFYNGAMSTSQARELLAAYRAVRNRPTRVIVLMGGLDFWSNGMHLHCIEAAESPGQESSDNINAINDLVEEILLTTSHLTLAAMHGNAAAGGVTLALAADRVVARSSVVLNPHYRNMGNLYGSEYWTYLLPARVGATKTWELVNSRLPLGASRAKEIGLVDDIAGPQVDLFSELVEREAHRMASEASFAPMLRAKIERRIHDERVRPLSSYRADEMQRMEANFYGFDPSFHVARYRFVHRTLASWTPLHLARHRQLGFVPPSDCVS